MTSSALRPSVTTGTVKTGAGWALTLKGREDGQKGMKGMEAAAGDCLQVRKQEDRIERPLDSIPAHLNVAAGLA